MTKKLFIIIYLINISLTLGQNIQSKDFLNSRWLLTISTSIDSLLNSDSLVFRNLKEKCDYFNLTTNEIVLSFHKNRRKSRIWTGFDITTNFEPDGNCMGHTCSVIYSGKWKVNSSKNVLSLFQDSLLWKPKKEKEVPGKIDLNPNGKFVPISTTEYMFKIVHLSEQKLVLRRIGTNVR